MAGAVICTLNTRHDSAMLSVLLRHSEAKVIFVDFQLLEIARGALDLLVSTESKLPILVLVPESDDSSQTTITSDTYEYERLLASGHTEFSIRRPRSELDPISVNYTSGTTSRPKGVSRPNGLNACLSLDSAYVSLQRWCLIWGLTAVGGTNICLRSVSPKAIFQNIEKW
ncbi:hypothetical protein HYC85_002077 [Camellia sinensis]|uniref:AMP-dependent synthetase/ligase domain-containing protein n=1 Tax=Camellia sinensis TaxID=4442 RepID=A0A7J7I9M0_CAMSI|nr:hypothetical protein HYC85_002077 [Camellia sinensis]